MLYTLKFQRNPATAKAPEVAFRGQFLELMEGFAILGASNCKHYRLLFLKTSFGFYQIPYLQKVIVYNIVLSLVSLQLGLTLKPQLLHTTDFLSKNP